MATLDHLKLALKEKAKAISSSPLKPLSESQYSSGFNQFVQGSGWATYKDFIIPELKSLLILLADSRPSISVLEIGPGPQSILGHIPGNLRRMINRYVAYEPNKTLLRNCKNGSRLLQKQRGRFLLWRPRRAFIEHHSPRTWRSVPILVQAMTRRSLIWFCSVTACMA